MEWVVIAAFNEEKYIGDVLKETKKYCNNIIVVDDGSKDKTSEIANDSEVDVLSLEENKGKGVAVKTGCSYAIKKGATQMILLDADGQHDPKDIPRFLKALGSTDIVFGYRSYTKKMPFIFRFGNLFINLVSRILFGIKLHDTQCGFRALKSEIYPEIKWHATRYSMESEMIANAGRAKLKYSEIPIKTVYNDNKKGTTIFDGIKIVFDMINLRIVKSKSDQEI